MLYLFDMDDVLADFENGLLDTYRAKHPDKYYIPFEQRNTFGTIYDYPQDCQPLIKAVYTSPGFVRSLPPINGGIEALMEINRGGHDVFICTSPLNIYENCVLEKYLWAEEHLNSHPLNNGVDWTKRMILTKDKTLIYGKYLLDDNPCISGIRKPSWEHIIVDMPYNRHITDKKRILRDWSNWKEVLKF